MYEWIPLYADIYLEDNVLTWFGQFTIIMYPISVHLSHQDRLGQDMFLTGAPGPLGRRLALLFCELAQREVEYVALSRDTTETDLKQRREITRASVQYVDQVNNNTNNTFDPKKTGA